MNIVGTDCTDIKVDEHGQPIPSDTGDFATVSGDECWKQDIRLEGETEEGELFFENADSNEAYGFGLMDFSNMEYDDFTDMEIRQRVSSKLAKREYIDQAKTKQQVSYKDGVYHDKVSISKQDSSEEYNIELSADRVEVDADDR